ncbi:hypothetical protein SAZ_42605 [Streptomyces noursei ZPM]|nr:hypothetical protein SAZ_00200 [Streptomyces noursei ZPM]AKA09318.1 hypothetical protein SAZ_42605 [Streptomyces noursei ZPM]EPY92318.1 hypothetical protein K530_53900 [Streptomyces noursei CCRC 11814]
MMRSAADSEMPHSVVSCRSVRFVRQYAATSRNRSSSGRLHDRAFAEGPLFPAAAR